MIRRVCESDAEAIARIYNQAIEGRVFATCDLQPVTPESRLQWLAKHEDPYPVFVFEHPSQGVLGWSALNEFSVRPAYRAVAEMSVYVDQHHRYRTIGGRLFLHLLTVAKQLGFRSLVSLTFEKNEASLRGLTAVRFRPVACLSEVALLHGQWENVVWLQKDLSDNWLEGLGAFLKGSWGATERR